MRFRAFVLIMTGLVLLCSAASAQIARPRQSATNPVAVYAPGTSSCGEWLDAREEMKTNKLDVRYLQFEAFLFGFASAYNWYNADAPSSGSIFGETDVYSQRAYLDKYCRDNPTDAFVLAVIALLNHLKSLQR